MPEITFDRYHEPFLGGAAVFFHLKPTAAHLSDLNKELIHTYNALKSDATKVASELRRFNNTVEDYYRIREAKFRNDFKIAARFIYLNQTSFNGIYRVNLHGKYNVPYGYRNKEIFNEEHLLSVSRLLQNATIQSGDFSEITSQIAAGDLVFLDPPYTVTHNNNGFIKYNQKLFSLEDQYRLSEVVDYIHSKGAYYILTNAAHSKIEEIFDKGHRIIKLSRASLIGGSNAKRGHYEEVIFTNLNWPH